MISLMSATLAGIHLYDTRRVVDSENAMDQVAKQRKNFDKWLHQILSGQLRLLDPTSSEPLAKESKNNPVVVNIDLDED
jgi:hypothetical protein